MHRRDQHGQEVGTGKTLSCGMCMYLCACEVSLGVSLGMRPSLRMCVCVYVSMCVRTCYVCHVVGVGQNTAR